MKDMRQSSWRYGAVCINLFISWPGTESNQTKNARKNNEDRIPTAVANIM